MKIGVIGCGAIGSVLCKFIDEKLYDSELVAICDIDKQKAENLRDSLKSKPKILEIDDLIEKSDMVVEAVSPSIVKQVLDKCIKEKTHLMVMSVAGIVENIDLIDKLTARLFIPSGAICGIDGIKAAAIEEIESVTITTTKNPQGLKGAPYVIDNNINLSDIKEKTTIYEGTAIDAIKKFPKNINVSATLSLAGIGPKKTIVKVIVDPDIKTNTHEIEIVGSFGRITTKTDNIPSPMNPKTSHLAILSACATLKRLIGNVKIGT